MRVFVSASLLALAGGCASAPPSLPRDFGSRNWNDCAIIAAVARDHYKFGPDNPPPPLWLDANGTGWAPRCDWADHGLSFARIHDPSAPPRHGSRVQWVSFKPPQYLNEMEATIEAGILHGPLAGMGVTCKVQMLSGRPAWAVIEPCRSTWIS